MILITGGAGFIGSNLMADLEREGAGQLAICDRLGSDERWRNIAKRSIAAFVAPENLIEWIAGQKDLQAVVHLAAISATTERDVDLLIDTNIRLTVALWDICAERGVPFIYASSAACYGGATEGFDDGETLAAMASLRPLNAYGWSKLATDRLLMSRVANGERTPPQWAALRFFNVYGPNEYHKNDMMSVAARNFAALARGDVIKLFASDRPGIADGEQKRDFVHVEDCTAIILWLLRNRDVSGLFNVGSGVARSFRDVIRATGQALGVEPQIEYVDMPAALRGRYQYFTQAEIGKLRAAGCDHVFRSLEDGLRDYVQSYLATDDSYR